MRFIPHHRRRAARRMHSCLDNEYCKRKNETSGLEAITFVVLLVIIGLIILR